MESGKYKVVKIERVTRDGVFSQPQVWSAKCLANKKASSMSWLSVYGGGGRIRTIEGGAGRFTVCSLWPL
ncbi:hypothetical protein, partial [Vibrio cholerae]|uniref:hypothetical protein n=2 Tax=Vibrio cholerae TaxID=666 RepID=UPI001F236A8A